MAYELMSREDYQISYAICAAANDLTDWRNGGIKLAEAELNACDWFHSGIIRHTKPKYVRINSAPATHYPKRLTAGAFLGSFRPTFYLQTGIFTYAVMGVCATTEATPNIHAITKDTNESPVFLAFHIEKEGTTHARRKDIVGMVPKSIDISCSEKSTIAFQHLDWDFSQTIAADDIDVPTALVQATHIPYNWFHYKDASSGSLFEYNSDAFDVDIVGFNMHIGWSGAYMGAYNGSGYPTQGLYTPPFNGVVTLDLKIKDGNTAVIDTVADLDHASYAGDIVFTANFYESATRYLKYTFTDMLINPDYDEKFQNEGDWYDGIQITLEPRNETTTVVVEEKNALDNDNYENPA